MSKYIELRKVVDYSDGRINIVDVSLEDFITTDCMLQDKEGVTRAESLPPSGITMPAYQPENILVANIRPYLKKIWFADKAGGCSADVLVFVVRKGYDPKYVYYSMFRDDFFNHMMQGSKGTKMPRGDKNHILDFLIPDLDLPDQQKIAEVLASLDAKIEINKSINLKLEQIARTIYDYWFLQFDFPNIEREPYKSTNGEMVWNDVLKRKIPQGWKDGTLSDIGEIIGGSTPSLEQSNYFTTEGIPWITPKDLSFNKGNKFISNGEMDVTEDGIEAASLNIMPKGTVLLSSRAPIGYMGISRGEVTTNQGFKSFVPKQGYSTPYVYYTVKNAIPAIISNASGSTFKEISGSVLKTITVCLPPSKLIEEFTKVVDPLFNKQDMLELENEQLSCLRDWLLPMLMNGQVKVQ